MKITKILCGEYNVYYITDSNIVYTPQWNNSKAITEVAPQIGLPTNIVGGAGGLHNAVFLDANGNVWTVEDNSYGERGNGTTGGDGSPLQVMKDNNGVPFTNVKQLAAYYFTNIAVKIDGSAWMWGQDYLGLFGASILYPTQLSLPSGITIAKIVEQSPLLFLDTNGGVWQWSVGSKKPSQVALPGKATDIAATGSSISIAIINGQIYAWNKYTNAWNVPTSPINMTSQWKVAASIVSIVGNDNTIHYIDSNGDLWGVGDNAMGEVGDGQEINFSIPSTINPLPYTWSWALFQKMITTPIQVMKGVKFQQICTQTSDVFYIYAQDTSGNWYSWGRNKSQVLGNGVGLQSNLASTYPNLADQPTPTLVTPLTTPIIAIPDLPTGMKIYATNTGYPISHSTTTTTSTSTTTTSTTTIVPIIPIITLFSDGTWKKV